MTTPMMKQEVEFQMICVVAMARNRVIGDGDDLIWHLPGDLKRVKQLTMGCPLIMGRRTFTPDLAADRFIAWPDDRSYLC